MPEPFRIDRRELPAAGDKGLSRQTLALQWSQLGDRVPRARHRDVLAPLDTLDHITAVIPELSDGHFGHGPNCITGDTRLVATNGADSTAMTVTTCR